MGNKPPTPSPTRPPTPPPSPPPSPLSPPTAKPTSPPTAIIGSAVKVQQLESGGVLSLAEVQVFGTMVGTNLALNVIASQSSTGYDGSASRAIDGNIDGHYGHNSVTRTDEHNKGKQWWMVDLKRDAVIQRIVVWNRSDCCQERLSNSEIQILDKSGAIVAKKSIGNASGKEKFEFNFS